ncbi:DUF397 domain-containing protein [Streptosporangium subroseum]|uniref:DUF397 domain-containing protein n=1 Tax=Streptosporangium subroseum TaxID=106412 RepID=UPI0034327056
MDSPHTIWCKSSLSGNGANCVEVAHVDGNYLIRDSKDLDGPQLVFSPTDWNTFLGNVKDGKFDTRS